MLLPPAEATQDEPSVVAVILLVLALVFLAVAYFKPPKDSASFGILKIFCMLAAGIGAGFFDGTARFDGTIQGFGIAGAQGFAAAFVAWLLFPKFVAPVAEPPPDEPLEDSYSFGIPKGTALGPLVELMTRTIGFEVSMQELTERELRMTLNPGHLQAKSVDELLNGLQAITTKPIRPYEVEQIEGTNVYRLRVIRPEAKKREAGEE